MNTSTYIPFFTWLLWGLGVLPSLVSSSGIALVSVSERTRVSSQTTQVSRGFEVLLQRANREIQRSASSTDNAMNRVNEHAAEARLELATSSSTLISSAGVVVLLLFIAVLVAGCIAVGAYSDIPLAVGRRKNTHEQIVSPDPVHTGPSPFATHQKGASPKPFTITSASGFFAAMSDDSQITQSRSLYADHDVLCNALVIQGHGVRLILSGQEPIIPKPQRHTIQVYRTDPPMEIVTIVLSEDGKDPTIMMESSLKFPVGFAKTRQAILGNRSEEDREVVIWREEYHLGGRQKPAMFANVKRSDACTFLTRRLTSIDDNYYPQDILCMTRLSPESLQVTDAHGRQFAYAFLRDPRNIVVDVNADVDIGLVLFSLIGAFKLT